MTHSIKMISAAIAAFAAISLPVANADAQSAQTVRTLSIEVPYYDLDVTQIDGAETLLRRIERTARRICRPAAGQLTVRTSMASRKCRTEAVSNAVQHAGLEMLTLAYFGDQPARQYAGR